MILSNKRMNNTGADQTVPMRRLVSAFVVRNPQDTFSGIEVQIQPHKITVQITFYQTLN